MNRPVKMGLLVFAAMVSAVSGTAQAPVVPLRTITLVDCLAAARLDSPDLKMASTTFDIAQATLALAKAANRLNLGESAQYLHQGVIVGPNTLPAPPSQAASAATFTGETFQGNLSLTGPSTSLGLTAQHTIGEWTSIGQVSSLTLSGSQTIWDGYLGGRAAGVYQQALHGTPAPAASGRTAEQADAPAARAARAYRRMGLSFLLTAGVLALSLLVPRIAYPAIVGREGTQIAQGSSSVVRGLLSGADHTVRGALGESGTGGNTR